MKLSPKKHLYIIYMCKLLYIIGTSVQYTDIGTIVQISVNTYLNIHCYMLIVIKHMQIKINYPCLHCLSKRSPIHTCILN